MSLVAMMSACGGVAAPAAARPAAAISGRLSALDPAALVVTSGAIERLGATQFETRSGAMRAHLAAPGPNVAELRFRFRGPTDHDAPLASGEIRRQIGLKLRAQDGCNVVYAMWHIAPTRGLEMSVKSNPGRHRDAECRDGGYSFLRPRRERAVADVAADSEHSLRASVSGSELRVYADGALSWVGTLPPEALAFDGPVGVRSDNGVFEAELRVGDGSAP